MLRHANESWETGVPRENAQSQVEIEWKSAHIQHFVICKRGKAWLMSTMPAWLPKVYSTGKLSRWSPIQISNPSNSQHVKRSAFQNEWIAVRQLAFQAQVHGTFEKQLELLETRLVLTSVNYHRTGFDISQPVLVSNFPSSGIRPLTASCTWHSSNCWQDLRENIL